MINTNLTLISPPIMDDQWWLYNGYVLKLGPSSTNHDYRRSVDITPNRGITWYNSIINPYTGNGWTQGFRPQPSCPRFWRNPNYDNPLIHWWSNLANGRTRVPGNCAILPIFNPLLSWICWMHCLKLLKEWNLSHGNHCQQLSAVVQNPGTFHDPYHVSVDGPINYIPM